MARKISTSSAFNKLRDLEREAGNILKDLTQQFTSDLQSQGNQVLQTVSQKLASGDLSGLSDLGGFSNLIGSALTFALTRPHASTATQETSRSEESNQQFRLSQSQAMAEAGVTLSKGNKNL